MIIKCSCGNESRLNTYNLELKKFTIQKVEIFCGVCGTKFNLNLIQIDFDEKTKKMIEEKFGVGDEANDQFSEFINKKLMEDFGEKRKS